MLSSNPLSFNQMAISQNASMLISCVLLLCSAGVACQSLNDSARNILLHTRKWNGTKSPTWDTHADVSISATFIIFMK
jgi:hypothetical protein